MNYTINANIYEIVDLNYKKKDSKGVALAPNYKKEQVKKRAFSLSTGTGVETFTAAEIIANVKSTLNLPDTIVDVKLTAQGATLAETEIVTSYGVKFEASFPSTTPVVETPATPEPVVETPVVEETPATPTPENPA